MNFAKQVELEALALQEPMNAVIDLGTSEIQKFYRGSTVFLTGATGFLGKLMIEKLLRSCDINKIYLLIREKKGKKIQDRVNSITAEPLFNSLRAKKPNFEDKIVPVSGDIAYPRLDLSNEDWFTLTNEVDIIFHFAATTRFDEPLDKATLINVRGTREILKLGKECKKLRSFIHISTAFAWTTRSRINGDVQEQFYECPIAPEALIQLVEAMDKDRLNKIADILMDDWPNSYTFTKAVAEELVKNMAGDLPICIVRPPIVIALYYEPAPGWLDIHSAMGPSGVLLGIGLGVIHVVYASDVKFCFAPGDYVTNATIAAGWDTAVRCANQETDIKIYTISNIRSQKQYSWGYCDKLMNTQKTKRLATDKSLWHEWVFCTGNLYLYWISTWLLHYIPAYILQFIFYLFNLKMPEGLPPNSSIVDIYNRIYKMGLQYGYFLNNEWKIHDNNTGELFDKLSDEDRVIYNFDIHQIDWDQLVYIWCVGVRKYILKDGLENTEQGRRKKQFLKLANYVFFGLYAFVIWKIIFMFLTILF